MQTWFTADLHLGHANIIKHCDRPFSDADDMDRALIANWNSVVGPKDRVYVLGDFAYKNRGATEAYLKKLRGRKTLVWGNHDSKPGRNASGWAEATPYLEIKLDGFFICLFHYACRVWNKSLHGSLMLYGHSHGALPGNSQSLDVGVDCWGYRPVTLDEIRARMAELPTFSEN